MLDGKGMIATASAFEKRNKIRIWTRVAKDGDQRGAEALRVHSRGYHQRTEFPDAPQQPSILQFLVLGLIAMLAYQNVSWRVSTKTVDLPCNLTTLQRAQEVGEDIRASLASWSADITSKEVWKGLGDNGEMWQQSSHEEEAWRIKVKAAQIGGNRVGVRPIVQRTKTWRPRSNKHEHGRMSRELNDGEDTEDKAVVEDKSVILLGQE